jgi:hypothetical protein
MAVWGAVISSSSNAARRANWQFWLRLCTWTGCPAIIENQPDGLDSEIISSIELSPPNRQHLAVEKVAILMISKVSLSETLMWRTRAGQARRIASMLSPRDAALVEAYARECEDCARAASIEGAGVNKRLSIETRRKDDQTFRSPARSRRPNQAA